MKNLKFIVFAIFALGLTANAQTGLESGTQYGHGEDSTECLMNYSLFSAYAKQKNYADAIKPWTYCFENCPAAGKGIYINGVNIVKWELKNAKTKEEKDALIEKLMRVYDQRIKYFGKDPKYPEAYILGRKAIDYQTLKKNDLAAEKLAYDWLKMSMDGLGASAAPINLNYYMAASFSLYSQNEITGERLIADYGDVQSRLDAFIARGGKNGEIATQMKTNFEEAFANSGAADCETMVNMFMPAYEATPNDAELLTKIINLFEKTECTDNILYYKASESMHSINPTAASAAGVAKMYLAQDDAVKAAEFYEKAISLETDEVKKSQYYYTIAYILYSKHGNYTKARSYAQKAVAANATWGEPYLLIGKMYAQSAQEQKIGKKDIENQAGYWAAVDMFNKAKRIDATTAVEANQLISIYKKYFPTKENIFFEPDYEAGKSARVGGWIGVSTVVRSCD